VFEGSLSEEEFKEELKRNALGNSTICGGVFGHSHSQRILGNQNGPFGVKQEFQFEKEQHMKHKSGVSSLSLGVGTVILFLVQGLWGTRRYVSRNLHEDALRRMQQRSDSVLCLLH
jgi:hypothetical protein